MHDPGFGTGTTGACRLAGGGSDRRLTLPLFEGIPGLVHAFSVRGSDPVAVLRACAGAPLPLRALRQVHGRMVHIVDARPEGPAPVPPPEGDALVTAAPGIALAVRVADCVPVLLCDASRGLVGAVHAGWRGTVAGVLAAAIAAMRGLGSVPADLLVGLGPSIGPCCFEVGPEVVAAFRAAGAQADACIVDADRARIDLPGINVLQAMAAGVRSENIAVAGLCTVCRPDLLESHRRSGGSPGRMTGLVAWLG
jgi:YfiH family protein